MNFKELKQEVEKVIEPYVVSFKLRKLICYYGVNDNDLGIYDPWDWNSPCCYSFIMELANTRFKASINPNDLECVLEISERDNDVAKEIFHQLYQKYKYTKREEADFSRFSDYGRDYKLTAYIGNTEIFLQTLRDYFETVYKN